MAISLFSIDQIPKEALFALRREHEFISKCTDIEELMGNEELKSVCRNMNIFCLKEGVIGIHYTKAIRREVEEQGLTLSTGTDRRKKFLEKHGKLFTNEQLKRIIKIWGEYFDGLQREGRDNRISFNFTFAALKNGGAERLLEYYGGEQVYMPLTDDVEIGPILRTIGEPLVLQCILNANQVRTFIDSPWGKIWLSSYLTNINPNARRTDQDGYQFDPVPPDHIIFSSPTEYA